MPNNGGNLLAFGEDIIGAYGGSGGSGGHIVINSYDTELPQEEGLKFSGGLNATDDSTNNRTVVDDNYEIIPWTTWQEYSAAQKAQHPNAIVTDAPDCDGDVEIDNWKDLWTNNNYSSAFPSSNVTLNSDDYDFLYFDCLFANTNYRRTLSIIIPKGQNGQIPVSTSTGNGVGVFWRNFTRVSDTEYVISDCSLKDMSTSTTTNNSLLIPYKIYGFKKKLTAKIKAIAHDVSTSASKCMMSDGVTSVEDKISNMWKTLATSSTSGTSAQKLASLQTALLGLTLEQRTRTRLVEKSATNIFVFNISRADSGLYNAIQIPTSSAWEIYTLSILGTFVYYCANGTIIDGSSSETSSQYELQILGE